MITDTERIFKKIQEIEDAILLLEDEWPDKSQPDFIQEAFTTVETYLQMKINHLKNSNF